MKITRINVKNKDTNYPVFVGNNALSLLRKQINSLSPETRKIALVLDKNIPQKYKKKIKSSLKKYQIHTKEYLPKENLKSLKNVNILVEYLLRKKFNRNDAVIAFGGGIIGDFTAFVASILKRGVNFINLPSTLLSQVDSSIGGKTGVNSTEGKNLIGSFYQPKLVISDLSLLKSLPKRELVCGFAEIFKYTLIRDKKFFLWIKKYSNNILNLNDLKIIKTAVVRSCKNKVFYVKKDEKEKGDRALLNFGHTFAHGIEAASNFAKINHGEAVLIGMFLATKLSLKMKLCSQITFKEIESVYRANNLPSKLSKFFSKKDYNKIANFMVNDKKNNDKKINLILLKKIGKTTKPGKIKFSLNKMKSVIKQLN